MTNYERLLYDYAHLKKDVHKTRNQLQILISWLKVKKPGIYEEFEEWRESEARKNDSKTQKTSGGEITLLETER